MVSKPRAVKSALSVTKGANAQQGEGEYCDTIRVQLPRNNKAAVAVTPEPPTSVQNSTPSSTGGMDDLSLTSPSMHGAIEDSVRTPERKGDMPPPERTLSSAVRRLTAKPSISKGSANNPIVLDEYSPRRKSIPLPEGTKATQKPYKHRDPRRYISYAHGNHGTRRPPLAPKAANGTRFTGDRGKDLGRMINAKAIATAEYFNPPQCQTQAQVGRATTAIPAPPQTQTPLGYGVPFQVQYPLSAQYLATQTASHGQYQLPDARYHESVGVPVNSETEEMVRRKAIQDLQQLHANMKARQYVQQLSDSSEPSETNLEHPRPGQMLPPSSTAARTKKFHIYKDRQEDLLTHITLQSSLLTSYLEFYPESTDKKWLLRSITRMGMSQMEDLKLWIEAESPAQSTSMTGQATEAEAGKDDEVRSLLSATAGMWQNGSGEGVADVYAEVNEGEAKLENSKKRKLGVCGWDMETVV